MIKKTISFEDLSGIRVSEDHYFNLNKAEIIRIEAGKKDGMEEHLRTLAAGGDNAKILSAFEELILMSYGKRSDDNRRFIKSEEISQAFRQSEAYSELVFEFFTNADEAARFFSALAPGSVDKPQNAPTVRADGRPIVQDRMQKAPTTSAPVYQTVQDVPEELLTTSEPADSSYEEFLAWKAQQIQQGTAQ